MISEKTLELNITHEILSLGDHLDTLIRFAASIPSTPVGRNWGSLLGHIEWRRPSFASGLTLTDESRRGWDVRIQYPATNSAPSHALFLQFKAGKHRNYSRYAGSAFRGTNRWRDPFCRFGFNNNSDRNQHLVLQQLSAQPQLQGAVAYVFPRIPNAATLKACIGHLIHVTSFITVADLDTEIARCGLVVNAGDEHEFRTAYSSPFRQEVCSKPKRLENLPDSTGRIVGEILACRVHQALRDSGQMLDRPSAFRSEGGMFWKNLFKAFEIEVAKYFGVAPDVFARATENKLGPVDEESLMKGVLRHNEFEREYLHEIGEGLEEEEDLRENDLRAKLYFEIASCFAPYRNYISNPDWMGNPVPEPSFKALAPLPSEGLVVRFKETEDIPSRHALERVLKTISYQAL